MKILGIDPGTSRIGFGLISDGTPIKLIRAGLFEVPRSPTPEKLSFLGTALKRLLKKERPDIVALETLFFSKNRTTALAVAEARGVILLVAQEEQIAIQEVNPMTVKRIIGGYGRALKTSLAKVLERLLHTTLPKGPDDISDAVAIALTALLTAPLDTSKRK